MTLEEAIKALREGKKIRHSSWAKEYFYYIKNGKLYNYENLLQHNISFYMNIDDHLDGWEIVPEKKTYYIAIYKDPKTNKISSSCPLTSKEYLPDIPLIKVIEFELYE